MQAEQPNVSESRRPRSLDRRLIFRHRRVEWKLSGSQFESMDRERLGELDTVDQKAADGASRGTLTFSPIFVERKLEAVEFLSALVFRHARSTAFPAS